MERYDALIIGAGPAGLAASLELRNAGWSVLLVEKSRWPRDKVCGGFIGPENRDLFQHFGVYEKILQSGAVEVKQLTLSTSNGMALNVPFFYKGKPAVGFGLSRKVMDEVFMKQARGAGVEIKTQSLVDDIVKDGVSHRAVIVDLSSRTKREVSALHVIDASGAGGVSHKNNGAHVLMGVSGLFQEQDLRKNVAMHFVNKGHIGVNPFEGGLTNVCYVVQKSWMEECNYRLPLLWEKLMASSVPLRKEFEGVPLMKSWKGVAVNMNRVQRYFDGERFFIGDAAALIHPIAGGGITLGLTGGMVLGRLLRAEKASCVDVFRVAQQYEKVIRKQFRTAIWASRWIGALGHHQQWAQRAMWFLQHNQKSVQNLFQLFHRPQLVAGY